MSSSRRARVDVGSPNTSLEFQLLNSNFEQVATGTGSLSTTVDPGIYQLQVRAGPRVESNLLVLQPGDIHRDLGVNLEFPSAAPLEGTTTSHEFQQQAVVDESAKLTREPGAPSGLVVVLRNARGQESVPLDGTTVKGIGLLDGDLRPVKAFAQGWKVDANEGWATWSSRLDPGGYVLRSTRGSTGTGGLVDQSLWLSPGWQTLVFVPNTVVGPDTDNASIHMTRLNDEWTPGRDDLSQQSNAALELALWGLREGRPVVPDDLVDLLLHSKFANPMLGLIGAHSLLLESVVALDRLDTVLGNLAGLVPEHPDLAALRWLRTEAERTATQSESPPYPQIAVSWPPMVSAGYAALIRLDARTKGGVVIGTLAETIAPNLVAQSVWTSWLPLPGSVPATRSRPGAGAAASKPRARKVAPRRAAKGGASGGRKAAMPPVEKVARPRATKATPPKAPTDPATGRVERYLDEVTRLSAAKTHAETLKDTTPDQISLATSLPVGSVNRALDELSSSWS